MIFVYDWNLFWTGLSAVSTFLSLIAAVFIYVLAKNELKKNNEISELDVYFKIKADLNSETSQKIYRAILEGHLQFVKKDDTPLFSNILMANLILFCQCQKSI